MAFHHVALATTDLPATHRFYTEAMGFTLVKAVVAPTPEGGGGWAKHVFYDTGGTHQPGAVIAVRSWSAESTVDSFQFTAATLPVRPNTEPTCEPIGTALTVHCDPSQVFHFMTPSLASKY